LIWQFYFFFIFLFYVCVPKFYVQMLVPKQVLLIKKKYIELSFSSCRHIRGFRSTQVVLGLWIIGLLSWLVFLLSSCIWLILDWLSGFYDVLFNLEHNIAIVASFSNYQPCYLIIFLIDMSVLSAIITFSTT
jgi:hypothetical protein